MAPRANGSASAGGTGAVPGATTLSLSQARRIAIAAQGLDRPRREGTVTMRGVQRSIDRLGLLQIDSVNVLARAHLMPLYSRLGAYDTALLDRATSGRDPRLVETWAHEASFVPPETYRLLEFRRSALSVKWFADDAEILRVHAAEAAEIRAIVRDEGPVTAAQIQERFEDRHPRSGKGWWEWSVAKRILERLFYLGEVASAGRTAAFERRYDLPERVLPARVLAEPAPAREDAVRTLVEL
ncbi:MAG: winged helix DNA-binding domain-containing protein, partial [Actinomycetota bacterium]|nr:winged helix DNA-binding domain-containing protein [Actinomycetota bacterium]